MTTRRPRGQLTRWYDLLARHLPHLSRAQRRTLALWSYAATLTEYIGQTTCAAFLAEALGESENTLCQRLREFYRPAAGKRGARRRELDVRLSFGPLPPHLGGVGLGTPAAASARARAGARPDRPPHLGGVGRDRLAVLTIAVVAHGCAIPVAWKALRANEPDAWGPHWQPMLARLAEVVPTRTRVVVLADRGLQSTTLFAEITALGWHPMIRLTRLGSWRERGQTRWTKLAAFPLSPGEHYVARGHLFSTKPHACTLVAVWRGGFEVPWLLMTDLSPARCQRAFYGLRSWRRGRAARARLPARQVGRAAVRAAADHRSCARRAGVARAGRVAVVGARGGCRARSVGATRGGRASAAGRAPPWGGAATRRAASRSRCHGGHARRHAGCRRWPRLHVRPHEYLPLSAPARG